ncbi:hypothetical protein ACFPVS_13525, partial [Neisseria weixii]
MLILPVSNKQSVTILDNARFHRRGILRGMQGKKRREVEHLASIFNATGGIFDQKHRRCCGVVLVLSWDNKYHKRKKIQIKQKIRGNLSR